MNDAWRRARYQVGPAELLRLLGVDGELISVTHDPVSGYVDIITADPSVEPIPVGAHVPPRIPRVEQWFGPSGQLIREERAWV